MSSSWTATPRGEHLRLDDRVGASLSGGWGWVPVAPSHGPCRLSRTGLEACPGPGATERRPGPPGPCRRDGRRAYACPHPHRHAASTAVTLTVLLRGVPLSFLRRRPPEGGRRRDDGPVQPRLGAGAFWTPSERVETGRCGLERRLPSPSGARASPRMHASDASGARTPAAASTRPPTSAPSRSPRCATVRSWADPVAGR